MPERSIIILIIVHQLTTLKKRTQVVELDDGSIRRVDRYKNLIQRRIEGASASTRT